MEKQLDTPRLEPTDESQRRQFIFDLAGMSAAQRSEFKDELTQEAAQLTDPAELRRGPLPVITALDIISVVQRKNSDMDNPDHWINWESLRRSYRLNETYNQFALDLCLNVGAGASHLELHDFESLKQAVRLAEAIGHSMNIWRWPLK